MRRTGGKKCSGWNDSAFFSKSVQRNGIFQGNMYVATRDSPCWFKELKEYAKR